LVHTIVACYHLGDVAQARAGGTNIIFGIVNLGTGAAAHMRESAGTFVVLARSGCCCCRLCSLLFAALRLSRLLGSAARPAKHVFDTIHEARLVLRQFLHYSTGESFQIAGQTLLRQGHFRCRLDYLIDLMAKTLATIASVQV
jgi:hypothetical protein